MAKAKKKKDEPIASLPVDELRVRLTEAREAKFRLHFQHATNPLKNPMVLRAKRREVARLMTFINKKDKEAV